MITTNESIGLGICLTVATALVSYLLYMKANSEGHSKGTIWRGLGIIWLCLAGAVAVLIAARATLGGPLFDVSLGQGKVWWQLGGSRQLYVAAGAVAILVGLIFIALRTAQNLQEPASTDHNAHNAATRGGQP